LELNDEAEEKNERAYKRTKGCQDKKTESSSSQSRTNPQAATSWEKGRTHSQKTNRWQKSCRYSKKPGTVDNALADGLNDLNLLAIDEIVLPTNLEHAAALTSASAHPLPE